MSSEELPEKIGRFQVEEKLGQGGMGAVYRAHDPRLNRTVAIKMMTAESLADETIPRRFELEAQVSAGLEHPYIVRVYEFDRVEGTPFLVMPYMAGGSLSQRLRQQNVLSPDEAVAIVERLAAALHKVHQKGLIHRDLKPSNVLLDEEGRAYLSDFGIVKQHGASDDLTKSGIIGTPAYMSPEQARGDKDIDGRSDVYALGILFFQILTGDLPYPPSTTEGAFVAHQKNTSPKLLDHNSKLPPDYQIVINRALAKEPEQRYQTVKEMSTALKRIHRLVSPARSPHLPHAEIDSAPKPAAASQPADPPSISRAISTTSQRISRQLRRLPPWARAGIGSLGLVLLFFTLYGVLAAPSGPTSLPAPTSPPTAAVSDGSLSPTAVSAPQTTITLLDWDDSAVWQTGQTLHLIPDDGVVPITGAQPAPLLHANAGPLALRLPDRGQIYLAANTTIALAQLPTVDGAGSTAVSLQNGRLIVVPGAAPLTVSGPYGAESRVINGLMGVTYDTDAARFTVDCLQGTCRLHPAGASGERLIVDVGRRRAVTAGGTAADPAPARYEIYAGLVNQLVPTPTYTPSPTASATTTATPSPSPTATPLSGDIGPDTITIGQSVLGEAITAVRFGNGPRRFIFVGGLQAGYAPNSVDLALQFIDHFRDNPATVPPDVTLYIVPNLSPDSPIAPGRLEGRLNANGVELNRNWGCRWSPDPLIMGAVRPGRGGDAPFSEPETRALLNFISAQRPTAVIFWTGHGETATASPGACIDQSRVSVSLAHLYGQAAGYYFVNNTMVKANPDLTGDAVNYLDDQGIPALAVLLPNFTDIDWTQNLNAVNIVLDEYEGAGAVPLTLSVPTPPPAVNCQAVAERWASLHAEYGDSLGCATGTAVQTNGAFQLFANGIMVWRGDIDRIYVLYDDGRAAVYTVDPPDPVNDPPLLKGGFGHLWLTNTAVQTAIGAPQVEEEVADNFTVQSFAQGAILTFDQRPTPFLIFTAGDAWLAAPE